MNVPFTFTTISTCIDVVLFGQALTSSCETAAWFKTHLAEAQVCKANVIEERHGGVWTHRGAPYAVRRMHARLSLDCALC